ncbi:hypothetical protein BCCH1_77840 (plasmid) [Burkholderia contaminans]|uniref:Uncharacterized protein n=1 Tax=Burkholderia contaminans TaxID=488447 RepID=A0A250LL72_9BURK|nr:hypothetical protein BCCH1_77840 [Burkholderia contaminans]
MTRYARPTESTIRVIHLRGRGDEHPTHFDRRKLGSVPSTDLKLISKLCHGLRHDAHGVLFDRNER